jgi:hypothetical protein
MNETELYAKLGEEHIDKLDHRTCQVRDLLIKRGKDPEKAIVVARRFANMELKQRIRWD